MDNFEGTQPKDIPTQLIASTSKNPFVSDIMSTSYSEITDAAISQNYEKMDVGEDLMDEERARPDSLYYDNIEFTVDDKNMKHFVADDLQYQIKIASPTSTGQSFSTLPKQISTSLPPQMDTQCLADIEIEAQYLAANVDNLTENLTNLLHSISAITADNVEVYKQSVTKLTETIDANIKSMYSIIAKSEEISKSMKKAESLSVKIKEIRRLVDMFDATL